MSVVPTTAHETGPFARRHRLALGVLWLQVPLLAGIGIAVGESPLNISLVSLTLAALALAGMSIKQPRSAVMVTAIGLLATSVVVAHLDGRSDVAHFHFFLMIAAISLYWDLVVLGLGLVGVAGYHLLAVRAGNETISWAVTHLAAIATLALLLTLGHRATRPVAASEPGGDLFRMSFEEAPVGMGVLKPSGELLEVNRAMAQILGRDRGSLVGADVSGLVHVDDLADLGEAWEEMGNAPGHSATRWMRCVTPDGQIVWGRVSLSLVPRNDDHSAMVILKLEDASRTHAEQQRLERLLEGKDRFVATVGDEIRQPLGMLIDLTDHTHDDFRDTIPRIGAHAREIASIVDDLVVSARAGTGSAPVAPHRIDAGSLCREVIGSIPGAEKVTFHFEATQLWADPALTRQIVNNLLGNATRYGGPSVSLRTIHSGPDTVIQVVDDGPAPAGVEEDRVFNGDLRNGPPVTRPAAVGLSLTVSRHLARQMDGDVVYRRTGDGENVFELRLPSEQVREIPRRRGVMSGVVSA